MRNALIALAATGALAAAAVPALAQSHAPGVAQREAALRVRIDDGFRHGDLSLGEAGRLRDELRQIALLDTRYQDDGMAVWQMRDLNARLSLLASRLNADLGVSQDEAANN